MTGAPEHRRSTTLAGEAALLLDAVAAKLNTLAQPKEHFEAYRPFGDEANEQGATTCPECGGQRTCSGCPLCRLLAALHGDRNETTAKFVDAALLVVSGLRTLLGAPESVTMPAGRTQPDGARPDSGQPDGARPDGARPDSARPDGAQPDGAQAHRAKAPGSRSDGAQPDGARPNGGQPGRATADARRAGKETDPAEPRLERIDIR